MSFVVVMEKVLLTLEVLIKDNDAVVTSDCLPAVTEHTRGHFVSLFQDLIGNAIKYRSEEAPRMHVSVRRNNEQLCFSVTDNGIGIASEYHAKIFTAFKRLHGEQKIAGTGIGLAMQSVNGSSNGDGRIWVESQPGEGSVFRFTIPDTMIVDLRV
jgi:light-regulated signal transduction histidine kinase (bacteriophytochrome)